jgi:hypothetical protein
MPHDVFISYENSDHDVAAAICAGLEQDGVQCWIAPRDIPLGTNFPEEIIKAISDTRLFILVLSKSADTSGHVIREVERAVKERKKIIPFRTEEFCPDGSLPFFLSTAQWFDAFDRPLEPHILRLREVVKRFLLANPLHEQTSSKRNVPLGPVARRRKGVNVQILTGFRNLLRTRQVPARLKANLTSPDWRSAITAEVGRVWKETENQKSVAKVLKALDDIEHAEEVIKWAFSEHNDNLFAAAILAVWAYLRSGSKRATEEVASGVKAMTPATRSSFERFYRIYLEKAAWTLSGIGDPVTYPEDKEKEHKERANQERRISDFCKEYDIEKFVNMSAFVSKDAISVPSYTNNKHDVFISYRRKGGEHLAGRIKEALGLRGFSIFMDVEDLKAGKFDEALFREIEEAKDVLVIMTEDCLDRCKNEDDWFRQEIRHAIKCNSNIVPILDGGFQMPPPANLPSDISSLTSYNGCRVTHEMFKANMEDLASNFLASIPKQDVRRSTE